MKKYRTFAYGNHVTIALIDKHHLRSNRHHFSGNNAF